MKPFNYERYTKNNPLLKESTNNELSSYLESSAQKCFDKGGNGQNLLDNLQGVAAFIDSYMTTSARASYEESGFYTEKTATAFKNLVNAMVADEITNNHASKYDAGGEEDDYDEFVDSINNLK